MLTVSYKKMYEGWSKDQPSNVFQDVLDGIVTAIISSKWNSDLKYF